MKWLTTLILIVIVVAYAIVGALIFSYLEAGEEQKQRELFYSRLNAFLNENSCFNVADVTFFTTLFDNMFIGGQSLDSTGTVINGTRWDYYTSIFVGVELIGTIGYPRAAPKTTNGRVFTLFFAFTGIPLFFLSAIGFGQLLNLLADLLLRLIARCRYGRRRDNVDESTWNDIVYGRSRRLLYRTTVITVVGFVLFALIPSKIFEAVEGWSYGEAVYYCFITLVTIGFGDFVPGFAVTPEWLSSGWYRIAVACWLLIIVGWFLGVATVIKKFSIAMVNFVENKAKRMTEDIADLTPNYVVDRTGNISNIQVQMTQTRPPLWKRFGKTQSSSNGDVTNVAVRTRDAASSRNDVTLASNAPSNTSVVDGRVAADNSDND